jgi:hypothetical protein
MERGELPLDRARVVIVSRRARGDATGSAASSTTLSLMPRWSADRAVDAAAQAMRRAERRPPPTAQP